MERTFIFVMVLWLGALGAAHAQVGPQVNPQDGSQASSQSGPETSTAAPPASATPGATQASPGGTGLTQVPCSTLSTSIGGVAQAFGCAADPLNVPASNVSSPPAISPTGPAAGAATGSTAGISAPPSINPQIARQLPGEASNTPTQGPVTTGSQPAAPSTTLCSPSIPSTAGVSSAGSLVGAISPSGC